MKKNEKLFSLVFTLVLSLLLVCFLGACKSKEKTEDKSESEIIDKDMLISVFGEGEGSMSGVLDVDQGPDEFKIDYYFFTEDMSSFDEAIEADLAPKIQEMYRTIPELDQVAFTIYVPSLDETPDKPYVSFMVTRKLVDETDWNNILELEFFEVVKDVKYYE
jgi:hypothetical protein